MLHPKGMLFISIPPTDLIKGLVVSNFAKYRERLPMGLIVSVALVLIILVPGEGATAIYSSISFIAIHLMPILRALQIASVWAAIRKISEY